jgi:hypothetical protein
MCASIYKEILTLYELDSVAEILSLCMLCCNSVFCICAFSTGNVIDHELVKLE